MLIKKRKNIFLISIAILILVLIGMFFYLGGWEEIEKMKKLKEESDLVKKAVEESNKIIDDYKNILAGDIYGGKTPQETIDMFIASLENKDFQLASKYFMPNNELSCSEFEKILEEKEKQGKIPEIIALLKEIEKAPRESINENKYFEFVVWDEKREMIENSIFLIFNELSGVWKIEQI
jgi:hypothetical protein